MKKQKGFTLIELITVIAIIGILASIVITSLVSAKAKARDHARLADISQLQLALEGYLSKNNQYPDALSDLVTAGYYTTIPSDPTNATTNDINYTYAYLKDSSTGTYCLGATMETEKFKNSSTVTCSTGNADNNYKTNK